MHSTWTGQDFGKQKPSEVFRDHFLTCFISDPVGVALRNEIGIDNICWEADYPHSDSMWPERPRRTRRGAQRANNVTDDEINKMTYENAMRWYHFDPFTHIAKDQATVGALRKAAEGHDVSIQALSSTSTAKTGLGGEFVAGADWTGPPPIRSDSPGQSQRVADRQVLEPADEDRRGVLADRRSVRSTSAAAAARRRSC